MNALRIILIATAALAISCFTSESAGVDDSPAAELASFEVAPEFEVNLFASESNGVVKPIQIRFDARGRLWVIGSTVYPQVQPGEKPNDKVLVLEDLDGDGQADKTTVFADGLMIPTGLEVVEDGCYVGHGAELLFLKDTDGDGKADERRVVLRGFGTGDNHQCINSFAWGPGGELFFCQGLHIRSNVETPWGIVSLHEAGLWRLRPRLLKLDGFFGSAHEPQNPWGWVFTDWGEPIVIAGNNSSHIYPVPGLVVNHRAEAPPQIWKNGNGRKCSNGDIVGTAHFPPQWQGALVVGGYINNAVWALQIMDDGAGFAIEDMPPLVRSSSRSFRPVDAKFGPDGALYIADWYNPIIGHYQASFRHPDRDKTHGRIWRITAKGRPLTKKPALAEASIRDLLDSLSSNDRWTRHFAKRVLAEKPTAEVTAALNNWTEKPGRSELDFKEALGLYQAHEAPAPALLSRLAKGNEPGARAYAASVAGAWASRLTSPLDLLRPLLVDEHPRVRLQAIVASTYITNAAAMEAVAAAADLPVDKFIQYALNQAVYALKPYWLPQLRDGKLNLGSNAARWSMLVRADGTPDTLQAVRGLLKRDGIDRATVESCWRLLADLGDAQDAAAILRLEDEALLTRLMPALRESVRVRKVESKNATELLIKRASAAPPELRAEIYKLAGLWKVDGLHPEILKAAGDKSSPILVRRAAVEALGLFQRPGDREFLNQLANDEPEDAVRAAAIVSVASSDVKAAAGHAARMMAVSTDASALPELIAAFLQRQGGAAAMRAAVEQTAPSQRAAAIGLEIMNSSGRRDEQLAALFTTAAGMQAANSRMDSAELTRFVAEVSTRGDARRGEAIYRRSELGCVTCHTINGQGGAIGPNLSALGTAQPIDFIAAAIFDPQKEVKEGFTAVAIADKDNEEYQGYILRETAEEVALRDTLQNKEVRLRKSSIAERRVIGSVMPPGLADTLTRDEFRDLVRYLSELGKAAIPK